MSQRYQRFLILILVIVALAAWIALPNNPGIHFAGINKDIETRLGLDLVGGVQALLEADLPAGTDVTAESMQTAVNIVENRVNGLGVNEAVVQQAGDRRIVVELPGETDPEAALAALKQTGLLEFVDMTMLSQSEAIGLQNAGAVISTDYAQGSSPITATETTTATQRIFHTVMTGAALDEVSAVTDPTTGQVQVAFQLKPGAEGADIFSDFTSQHVSQVLAIVLDKRIISAPTIDSAITSGEGVISGDFTIETANALAVQLRYGSLPVPLKVVESRTVGPTLGRDSLNKSMLAGAIGFTIVILFMALYYRLPGIVAVVALLIYALVAYALFRWWPITLTLPGIAGFLLSTGSALDANILIFERLKEELRAGKALGHAADLAWKRAWPSIRDSNIATLITCAILFWFGSTFGATIVKGFSITLALGVLISLFTALVVTRTLFNLVASRIDLTGTSRRLVSWFGI